MTKNRSLLMWPALALFVAIHLSYYVSALWTDHLLVFFPWDAIQTEKTLDYSQVPNGAQAFFEGGPISAEGVKRDYPVLKRNVYHPVFTLAVGTPLQWMDIRTGFVAFGLVKLAITGLLFGVLFRRYRHERHFLWAAFIFWTSFPQVIELSSGQYHFLLNAAVFLLLYGLLHGQSSWWLSACYLGSLLVKPIGVLWFPQLVLRRKFLIAAALVVFVGLTAATHYGIRGGDVYLMGLRFRAESETQPLAPDREAYFNLEVVLVQLGLPAALATTLKYFGAAALGASFLLRRMSFIQGVLLSTCYYLMFYSGVFEYHYTSLIPVLTLGVLTQPELQHRFARFWMIVSCLPSPYILLHALPMFAVSPHLLRGLPPDADPSRTLSSSGLLFLVLFRVLPVVMLAAFVVGKVLEDQRPAVSSAAKSAVPAG